MADPIAVTPWRPLMPPNPLGEVLCFRQVKHGEPGIFLAESIEYAWLDREGRYLRPGEVG